MNVIRALNIHVIEILKIFFEIFFLFSFAINISLTLLSSVYRCYKHLYTAMAIVYNH